MMDPDERALFAATLREAIVASVGNLDDTLLKLGWADALTYDRRTATETLFDLQGETNTTSSAIEIVVGEALGLESGDDRVVLLPEPGQIGPPGVIDDDGHLSARGVALALGTDRSRLVIASRSSADEYVAVTVPLAAATIAAVGGMDPTLGLVSIQYEGAVVDSSPVDWDAASNAARVAISHEIVGSCRTMLAQACDHARERIQFGQPIATFQAVRHRLAEAYVAIESATTALDAAWAHPSDLTATMAKVIAGRSAKLVGKHTQQVLAGIGFTLEHPFHRFLFRTMVLDKMFGDSRQLSALVGRELLRARELPAILPL